MKLKDYLIVNGGIWIPRWEVETQIAINAVKAKDSQEQEHLHGYYKGMEDMFTEMLNIYDRFMEEKRLKEEAEQEEYPFKEYKEDEK